jgi:FkbM family methyltransferase
MPVNWSEISADSLVGRALRIALRALPRSSVMRIRRGPARGMRWVIGDGVHGYWLGTYELDKQLAMQKLVRPGMTVYDVGANRGFYALFFSQLVGPGGRVYALEPLPSQADALLAHVRMNNIANAWIVEAAAGDKTGMSGFTFDRGATENALAAENQTRLMVATIRLDDAGLPPADFIKIDVEGAELAVLHGAARMLGERRPILFVALDGKTTRRECLNLLDRLGYNSFTLDGRAVSGIEPDEIYAMAR